GSVLLLFGAHAILHRRFLMERSFPFAALFHPQRASPNGAGKFLRSADCVLTGFVGQEHSIFVNPRGLRILKRITVDLAVRTASIFTVCSVPWIPMAVTFTDSGVRAF